MAIEDVMPNDLKAGMKVRYWPAQKFYRRIMWENVNKPDSSNLPAVEDVRIGEHHDIEIRIVVAGMILPSRKLKTHVFFTSFIGNLLLDPEKPISEQGLEVLDDNQHSS